MRETRAEETPYIKNGVQLGLIQKYYKYGMWNYRAIIFKPHGIISGNFYDKTTAQKFIEKNAGGNHAR